MQSITNNIARTAVFALAAFALVAVAVAGAPKAQAADLDFGGWGSDYYTDYSAPSYDYGSGWGSDYYTDYTSPSSYDYGSGWTSDSYTDYTSPSSYYGGGCSSCGGGFSGGGFGGFSNPGFGFGGTGGSTFAPTTVSNNVPTTIYSPSNTNICTGGNTCNTDDHSIFNAPTTVTVTNPAPAQTQVVYQQVPVYQQPNYPVYNPTPCCYQQYQQPVVYPQPVRQPYVSLNQVPYTGLDLGPVGTVLYWGFLVLWCLVAAYLIVYKRVQTKVFAGLNRFLFGAPAVGTHAKVVMPAASHSAHTAPKAYVAPVAHNDDAIDPFIASQIARNK